MQRPQPDVSRFQKWLTVSLRIQNKSDSGFRKNQIKVLLKILIFLKIFCFVLVVSNINYFKDQLVSAECGSYLDVASHCFYDQALDANEFETSRTIFQKIIIKMTILSNLVSK